MILNPVKHKVEFSRNLLEVLRDRLFLLDSVSTLLNLYVHALFWDSTLFEGEIQMSSKNNIN